MSLLKFSFYFISFLQLLLKHSDCFSTPQSCKHGSQVNNKLLTIYSPLLWHLCEPICIVHTYSFSMIKLQTQNRHIKGKRNSKNQQIIRSSKNNSLLINKCKFHHLFAFGNFSSRWVIDLKSLTYLSTLNDMK